MGNWIIYIEGCGAHDNDRPYDSDAIAQECVEKLKAAGQTVRIASFMAGAPPKNLLSEPRKGDDTPVEEPRFVERGAVNP